MVTGSLALSPFRIAYYTPNSTIKNTLLSYNKKSSLTCGPAASAALFANVATALFMVEMFAVQCLLAGDERRDNRKANAPQSMSVPLPLFSFPEDPSGISKIFITGRNNLRVF